MKRKSHQGVGVNLSASEVDYGTGSTVIAEIRNSEIVENIHQDPDPRNVFETFTKEDVGGSPSCVFTADIEYKDGGAGTGVFTQVTGQGVTNISKKSNILIPSIPVTLRGQVTKYRYINADPDHPTDDFWELRTTLSFFVAGVLVFENTIVKNFVRLTKGFKTEEEMNEIVPAHDGIFIFTIKKTCPPRTGGTVNSSAQDVAKRKSIRQSRSEGIKTRIG